MSKTTTAETIDLISLQTLEQFPLVAPLYAEKCSLLNRQHKAQEALDMARATMRQTSEIEDPAKFRKARREAELIEETLSDMRASLIALNEKIEAAKSQARYELRPLIEAEAVPLLEQAEKALIQLVAAQDALMAYEQRVRRLSVGVLMGRYIDPMLPGRLEAVQTRLRKLQW